MLSRKIFLLLVAVTVISIRMQGQIFAPDANASFNATYNLPDGIDKVFVFNRLAYKAEITASIKAVSVDSTSGWSFQWSVFDWVTKAYNVIGTSGSGWFSEIDTITLSSGYKVEMTRGADTSIFRIWLLINDLDLKITNKDHADTLLFGYYNCSSIDFRAETIKIPLFYYNLEKKIRSDVGNSYRIRWKTNNDEASVPPPQLITRVTKPPSKDTWYKITVTDNFGLIRSDSVFYKSIQSEAHITAKYISLSDTAEYPGKLYRYFYDSLSHSAPGKFSFDVSESRNMVSYTIDFGDNETVTLGGDSLHVIHEYEKPGTYNVVLTTKSALPFECIDKDSVGTDLVKLAGADDKNFIMPNVFTPNNDGNNDRLELSGNLDELYSKNNFFRSDDISVLTIDISIFSRSGRKVHEYAGSIREWQGWDGKIMNSDRDAPEGVYFYVITQLSAYEDKANPINKKIFKGFLHLYRE
jgi:hypothetical protein